MHEAEHFPAIPFRFSFRLVAGGGIAGEAQAVPRSGIMHIPTPRAARHLEFFLPPLLRSWVRRLSLRRHLVIPGPPSLALPVEGEGGRVGNP